jgi:uncharacterized protein
MDDERLRRRREMDSPCVDVCVIHRAAKICVGCYRTGDEIAQWSRLSPEQRSAIRADLPERASLLTERRGGRAARLQSSSGSPDTSS